MQLAEIRKSLYAPQFKDNFIQIAGIDEGKFKSEIGFAVQQIKNNPKILEASAESVFTAVMNAARLGLSLNPAQKQSYLIPRWSKGGTVAHLEPSYMGLIHLAIGKSIKKIDSCVVYDNDKIKLGARMEVLEHSPYWLNGHSSKGKIIGVYSFAELTIGSSSWEFMGLDEVEEIRESSESWKAFKAGKLKTCVWDQHPGEMIKKTCIKRHLKRLQSGDSKLSEAIELTDTDWKQQASTSHVSYAEQMLFQAHISDEERELLTEELHYADRERVTEIIEQCKNSMPNEGKTKQGLTAEQTAHLDSI